MARKPSRGKRKPALKRKPATKRKPALKRKPSVSRATRSKRSRGVKAYWRRVREIQQDRKITIGSARRYYKAREQIAFDRFERIAIDRPEDRPKYVSKRALKEFGKVLESGKDKGRIVMYYDRVKKEPIKARTALKMRRKNTVKRIALKAQELTKTQQGEVITKFWPKYALKRGYLTEFEAMRFAKKILRLRKTDDSLRVAMKNVFGYS